MRASLAAGDELDWPIHYKWTEDNSVIQLGEACSTFIIIATLRKL